MSANPSMMSHSDSMTLSQSNNQTLSAHTHVHQTKPSSIEYRVVYALVYTVCLAITGLCRLLPRNSHPWMCAGDDGSRSLFSEARCAADSTVPYIFQK